MEFLIVPAAGNPGQSSLLGLSFPERARRMLESAGLRPASGPAGAGDLVLYPAELVGVPRFGRELAGLKAQGSGVLAGTPRGAARPVLVVGGEARARVLSADLAPEAAWEAASAAVTLRGEFLGPAVSVVDPAACEKARDLLLRAVRNASDGPVSRALNRPMSIALSTRLVDTPIHPHVVTAAVFVLALVAAWMMAAEWFVAGALSMHVSSVLDGCDGEIARLKYRVTELGGRLDPVFHDASDNLFGLGTGIGVFRWYQANRFPDTWGKVMLALAILAFVVAILLAGWNHLRAPGPGASGGGRTGFDRPDAGNPLWRYGVKTLAVLGKRDTFLFLFLLLAVAQVPSVIVILYFLGTVAAAGARLARDPGLRSAVRGLWPAVRRR